MEPLWQGCRLLTSSVAVAAVMLRTDTASVTGTELSEKRLAQRGSGPLQAGSGGLVEKLKQSDSTVRELISKTQKHMAQIFPPNLWEKKKIFIAEMDSR